jgi:polar amino acid transport system permease protein
MTFHWDWGFAFAILPQLARALVVTVAATVVGSAAAMVIGLVLAV